MIQKQQRTNSPFLKIAQLSAEELKQAGRAEPSAFLYLSARSFRNGDQMPNSPGETWLRGQTSRDLQAAGQRGLEAGAKDVEGTNLMEYRRAFSGERPLEWGGDDLHYGRVPKASGLEYSRRSST